MGAFDQIAVRLQLTTVSNPSAPPLDLNTGEFPQCFAGSETVLEIGIFNGNQVCVDLGNLDALEVSILADRISSSENAPLVVKTIDQAELTDIISWENWIGGIQSQATVVLTTEDTSLDLLGKERRKFYLQIRGAIGSTRIVYGLAQLYIYDSGDVTVVPRGWNAYTDDWDNYSENWNVYGNTPPAPSPGGWNAYSDNWDTYINDWDTYV